MKYNFDEVIDRHGTYCTQWDYVADRFGRADLLPFTISDMDIAAPPAVVAALAQRLDHPVFGYSRWNHAEFKGAVSDWYERRYGCAVNNDSVVYSPTVLFSIALLLELLSQPGDGVIVQNPAYDGFFRLIPANGRRVVINPLQLQHGEYRLDFEHLEQCAKHAEVLLWCNPHNPTGRVWTRQETERVVGICRRHNVKIISDEIHADIIYAPNSFVSMAHYAARDVFILSSASKTFNIPGLQGSYGLLFDERIRDKFIDLNKHKYAVSGPSIFGMYGLITAYDKCEDWVDELVEYLRRNMRCVEQFIKDNKLAIKFVMPQATYLAWLDCSPLGYSDDQLQRRLIDIGNVAIMSGSNYGQPGYLRLNVGCSRSKLLDGLARIKQALQD